MGIEKYVSRCRSATRFEPFPRLLRAHTRLQHAAALISIILAGSSGKVAQADLGGGGEAQARRFCAPRATRAAESRRAVSARRGRAAECRRGRHRRACRVSRLRQATSRLAIIWRPAADAPPLRVAGVTLAAVCSLKRRCAASLGGRARGAHAAGAVATRAAGLAPIASGRVAMPPLPQAPRPPQPGRWRRTRRRRLERGPPRRRRRRAWRRWRRRGGGLVGGGDRSGGGDGVSGVDATLRQGQSVSAAARVIERVSAPRHRHRTDQRAPGAAAVTSALVASTS